MEETQFTEQELKYINAGICDENQDIHAVQLNPKRYGRRPRFIFESCKEIYGIRFKLPRGRYELAISDNDRSQVADQLMSRGVPCCYNGKFIYFIIYKNMEDVVFGVIPQIVKENVVSLRKQAVINKRNLLKNQDIASVNTIK